MSHALGKRQSLLRQTMNEGQVLKQLREPQPHARFKLLIADRYLACSYRRGGGAAGAGHHAAGGPLSSGPAASHGSGLPADCRGATGQRWVCDAAN